MGADDRCRWTRAHVVHIPSRRRPCIDHPDPDNRADTCAHPTSLAADDPRFLAHNRHRRAPADGKGRQQPRLTAASLSANPPYSLVRGRNTVYLEQLVSGRPAANDCDSALGHTQRRCNDRVRLPCWPFRPRGPRSRTPAPRRGARLRSCWRAPWAARGLAGECSL